MAVKSSQTVEMVVDGICRHIKAGSYRSGSALPTEQLLAMSFGVSRGTVRRAIDRLIETGALTRRPHSRPIIATGPSPVRMGNEVHVWVSRPIADGQALALIKEISKGLRGTTYRLVVREPSRFVGTVVKSDERDFLLNVLANPDVAGAIIERDPYSDNDEIIGQLVERGKHLVFVDTPPPPGVRADFVGTTNVSSARACVEHLLDMGHSRIFFVADCDHAAAISDRLKGYWRAMRQSGLESLGREIIASSLPSPKNVDVPLAGPYARFIKKNEYFAEFALRAVEEILTADLRPTALFVCHDVMAFWVCAILEGKGVRVPEDISVVGFDRLANWDDSIRDIMTSAGQDFQGFGRHAANLLLDRLTEEVPSEPRHVLLDAPLVVRSSTTSDLMLPALEPNSARAELPR